METLVSYLARLAMLLSSQTMTAPVVTAGITSGQGGQAGASAATSMNMGQSGTPGTQTGLPRTLRFMSNE